MAIFNEFAQQGNPGNLQDVLKQLLGGQKQGFPIPGQPQGPHNDLMAMLGAGQPPQEQEEPEISVSAPEPSRYREGIFKGGPFRTGSLGGNILGALGDAFLVQSGNKPVYAPRLKEAREAEALQGYDSDPELAGARYRQVSPDKWVEFNNREQDNRRQQSESTARLRNYDFNISDKANSTAMSYLAGADEKTYPTVKRTVEKYYAGLGIPMPFDLPTDYDPAMIQSLANGDIPVAKQIDQRDMRTYRADSLSQKDRAEAERTRRYNEGLNVRRSEGAANRGVRVSEGNANRSVRQSEGNANRTSRETIASTPRPRAGTAAPRVRYRIVNGKREVVQ